MEERNEIDQINIAYVGFWKRIIVYLIDYLILAIPMVYLYRYSVELAIDYHSEIPLILKSIILFAFYIFMTVRFGGTPGKLILGARIVNQHGEYLSISRAILRTGFLLINGCVSATTEVLRFNKFDVHILSQISPFIGLLLIVDALFILFNKEKRALHDYIVNSYVISKNLKNK